MNKVINFQDVVDQRDQRITDIESVLAILLDTLDELEVYHEIDIAKQISDQITQSVINMNKMFGENNE